MIRQPPRSTRTDTRFPYTTLCRSRDAADGDTGDFEQRRPPAEDRRVRPMHAILGRGWIEGAERDIIGPRLPCLHREVAAVMACHADLRRRPKQTARLARVEIGRASCRKSGCQNV